MTLTAWAHARCAALEQAGTRRTPVPVSSDGPVVIVDGQRRLNFASNDYLAIGSDPTIRTGFHSDASFAGASARLQTGTSVDHAAFEAEAEGWWGQPVLAFGSGWHANVGVISALADRECLVIADKLVHASILDGIRLSGATLKRYRHNDLTHLHQLLASSDPQQRTFVITESVFSMDGDRLDLPAFVDLTSAYPHVATIVDEAHAIGVYGPEGRGLVSEHGVEDQIDMRIGPLGKAMASVGALVSCDPAVKTVLQSTARSFLFSTALPPIQAAWSRYALDVVRTADDRRHSLAQRVAFLTQGLAAITGQDLSQTSHIIPLVLGDIDRTRQLAQACQGMGWHVMAIVPPTVPAGTARLRLSVRADMAQGDLAHFLDDLSRLWPRYQVTTSVGL